MVYWILIVRDFFDGDLDTVQLMFGEVLALTGPITIVRRLTTTTGNQDFLCRFGTLLTTSRHVKVSRFTRSWI